MSYGNLAYIEKLLNYIFYLKEILHQRQLNVTGMFYWYVIAMCELNIELYVLTAYLPTLYTILA